jgi:hypothetical protein
MKQYQLKEVKEVVTTETKPTMKLKVGLPVHADTHAGAPASLPTFGSGPRPPPATFSSSRALKSNLAAVKSSEVVETVIKAAVVNRTPTTKLKVGLPVHAGTRAGVLSGGAGHFPSSRALKANLTMVESHEVLDTVIKAAVVNRTPTTKLKVGLPAQTGTRAGLYFIPTNGWPQGR